MSDRVDVEGQIRSETQGAGYDVAIGMSHPQDSFDAAMADIQAGGQQSVSGEAPRNDPEPIECGLFPRAEAHLAHPTAPTTDVSYESNPRGAYDAGSASPNLTWGVANIPESLTGSRGAVTDRGIEEPPSLGRDLPRCSGSPTEPPYDLPCGAFNDISRATPSLLLEVGLVSSSHSPDLSVETGLEMEPDPASTSGTALHGERTLANSIPSIPMHGADNSSDPGSSMDAQVDVPLNVVLSDNLTTQPYLGVAVDRQHLASPANHPRAAGIEVQILLHAAHRAPQRSRQAGPEHELPCLGCMLSRLQGQQSAASCRSIEHRPGDRVFCFSCLNRSSKRCVFLNDLSEPAQHAWKDFVARSCDTPPMGVQQSRVACRKALKAELEDRKGLHSYNPREFLDGVGTEVGNPVSGPWMDRGSWDEAGRRPIFFEDETVAADEPI